MERQVQKPTNTSGELYTWSHGKALVDDPQAQENIGSHSLRVSIVLTDLWLWNQFSLQIKQLFPSSTQSRQKVREKNFENFSARNLFVMYDTLVMYLKVRVTGWVGDSKAIALIAIL